MRRQDLNPFTSGVLYVKGFLSLVLIGLSLIGTIISTQAQLSISVQIPTGETLEITGKNMARGDEALVVYDQSFGKTTRTNLYGVEVLAKPLRGEPYQYQIEKVTSIWECQKLNAVDQCGNVAIPPSGIVLSATGAKRDILKKLKPGDILSVQEVWFQERTSDISIINPTPENNPGGSGFPGYRASNQLIIYDAAYGRPTTGTNEFGFEVTVENGIVTTQEGSDSTIPVQNGFVLSGHGKGRSWLIANAPVGAKMLVSADGKKITSVIDFDTYQYQLDRQWQQSPCADYVANLAKGMDPTCRDILKRKDQASQLYLQGNPSKAVKELTGALDALIRHTWKSFPAFPSTATKGAWHRPVEKNRQEIGQKLDMLKEAGLNSVFLETYFHGYTIFPSETFKAYGLPAQNPKFAGVDLLKLWVEEAHKRNMKVHVWFQTFYAGTKAYLPPGPVLAKYPQWANVQYAALVDKPSLVKVNGKEAMIGTNAKPENGSTKSTPISGNGSATGKSIAGHVVTSGNGQAEPVLLPSQTKETPKVPVASNLETGAYFFDPANPEVQDFVSKLANEIVSRYDIDGFQLDYIRYPSSFPSDRFSYHKTTWGYTPVARQAFKAKFKIDPVDLSPKNPEHAELWNAWSDFKTAQVNQFVERVTKEIRKKKPKLKISAAIFPEADAAKFQKHQDWVTWSRNGWVDFLAPMTLTSAIKVVERDTRYLIQATNNKVPVYSGIFGPFNNNSADHVLRQIEAARSAGAGGFVLFDTAHLTGQMLEALQLTQNTGQPVK